MWFVVLEGPPPRPSCGKLLFWLFYDLIVFRSVLLRQLKRFGSDFGSQNLSRKGSRFKFAVLKGACCVKHLQHGVISCVVWCWSQHAYVHFDCKNTSVLNDFDFAFLVVNVILFLLNLFSKALKINPNQPPKVYFSGSEMYILSLSFPSSIFKLIWLPTGPQMAPQMGSKIGATNGLEALR